MFNELREEETSPMIEILKSLAQHELTTVLIVLGLVKEVRLLTKAVLDYKIEKLKLTSNKDEAV